MAPAPPPEPVPRAVPLAVIRCCAVALVAAPFAGAVAGEPVARWGTTAVALAAGLVAFVLAGSERMHADRWCSPVDRLILAGLTLSALQTLGASGSDGSMAWLRQLLACGIAFYALLAVARRTAGASDAIWSVFGATAFGLGLHAMWASTAGLERLAAWSAETDALWVSQFGLGKTVLIATLIAAGRAREPGASPAWRVAALVGGIGTLLHAAVGGLGLGAAPLALLEQPLYFSVTVAALLLLASMAKRAWTMRREHARQAWRWRGLALGFVGVAALAAFGGTTGGEGLRMIVTLAAVVTLVAAEEPAEAEVAPLRPAEPPGDPIEAKRAA